MTQPVVLFLCVHNAGRSQMAAAWTEALAGHQVRVLSGGSQPAAEINPQAIEAMSEVGIDLAGRSPRSWDDEMIRTADVVVTMGCGDECPFVPGRRYEDWEVEDPHGGDLDVVRRVRDDVERRVRRLLAELDVEIETSTEEASGHGR